MPIIFPNTSNNFFLDSYLFSVIERFTNYVFEDDKPPTVLGARIVSYALGGIKGFHTKGGHGGHINFRGGSLDWKLKVLVPFLIVESDWGATRPHPLTHHFPKHI